MYLFRALNSFKILSGTICNLADSLDLCGYKKIFMSRRSCFKSLGTKFSVPISTSCFKVQKSIFKVKLLYTFDFGNKSVNA